MGRFCKTLAAACFATAISIAATVADAADKSKSWEGFYAGGSLGGAWSTIDSEFHNEFGNFFNTNSAFIIGTKFGYRSSGLIGGAHAGYNFQTGPWVYGIEASFSGARLNDRHLSNFGQPEIFEASIKNLYTVTGRLGYATPGALVYGRLGWAGADVNLTMYNPGSLITAVDDRFISKGVTLGVGAEMKLARQISLGLEYDFTYLRADPAVAPCPLCNPIRLPVISSDITINAITARLNYHFN